MNIHAPQDAREFFSQFNFVGKPLYYDPNPEGEGRIRKFIKVKLKQPMTSRKSYFYSFEHNAIAHGFKDFDLL